MKCEKCGFVSFDYLSECRRCGADLVAIRERLGFSALKSEVPFLLGALLKGGGTRDTPQAGGSGESEGPGMERISSREAERSFPAEGLPANLTASPEVQADPPTKEELIIELSEADLESLSGAKESNRMRVPVKNP